MARHVYGISQRGSNKSQEERFSINFRFANTTETSACSPLLWQNYSPRLPLFCFASLRERRVALRVSYLRGTQSRYMISYYFSWLLINPIGISESERWSNLPDISYGIALSSNFSCQSLLVKKWSSKNVLTNRIAGSAWGKRCSERRVGGLSTCVLTGPFQRGAIVCCKGINQKQKKDTQQKGIRWEENNSVSVVHTVFFPGDILAGRSAFVGESFLFVTSTKQLNSVYQRDLKPKASAHWWKNKKEAFRRKTTQLRTVKTNENA